MKKGGTVRHVPVGALLRRMALNTKKRSAAPTPEKTQTGKRRKPFRTREEQTDGVPRREDTS